VTRRLFLASILVLATQARGGVQTPGCQPGPGPHRWYVDVSVIGGANSGTSWGNACRELQRAIQLAQLCDGADEIWVAAGTYYPDRTAQSPQGDGDPEATFQLRSGVSIYGGFLGFDHPSLPGGETELHQRDPDKNLTILSGNIGEDTYFPIPPDTYNVVTAEYGANGLLDGFTIEGGYDPAGMGGGLYVIVASPTIANCTFRGNRAARGGGTYIWTYDFEIAPTFINCRFLKNASLAGGGGGAAVESAYFFYCETSIVNATFINCLFSGNTAATGGGAISVTKLYTCANATATVRNCTFSQNLSADGAGAIDGVGDCFLHGWAYVSNSILWGNGPQQIDLECLVWTISDSDIEGQSVPGNISLDPMFCDPIGADGVAGTADDNPRLGEGSPAIDAGSDAMVTLDVPDLGGWPRQFEAIPGGALVDMGAYENQHRAACPWDLDGNALVDFADLAALVGAWGACPGCAADFECDLATDVNDFLALLQRWGPCPGP
jgi:predicted outer membrane repeat protein